MRALSSTYYFAILILSILVSSCNYTKYLADTEYLYDKTAVDVSSEKSIKEKGTLESNLEKLAVPKENSGFAKNRLLWYNATYGKEKRIPKWINENIGEAPVLYETGDAERSVERMERYLFNNGYFDYDISYALDTSRQRIGVKYDVKVNSPYYIRNVFFVSDSTAFNKTVIRRSSKSLLKRGEVFSVSLMDKERSRIKKVLREEGYYRFNNDYVRFEIDSTAKDRKLDIYVKVNPPGENETHQKSYIRNVVVYPDYSSYATPEDTLVFEGIRYIYNSDFIHPEIIIRSILFRKGQVYNEANYNRTVNNLVNLGIYRFVNISIDPYATEQFDSLDVTVYLTTKQKLEFEIDLEVNSKTGINDDATNLNSGNSFNLGTAASISHSNLNTFGGGERLTLSLFGGLENQIGLQNSLINAIDINAQANLLIPKFLTPFPIRNYSSRFIPKTNIGFGIQYFNRLQFYELATFNLNLGYQWRETLERQHRFDPISVSYLNLIDTKPAFDTLLLDNPALEQSFEQQIILGSKYSFTYNSQIQEKTRNFHYVKTNIEWAGNLASSIFSNAEDTASTLLNVRIAQFVRLDAEYKYYRFISPERTLATRWYAGIGVPYGNSDVLPYSRQFFSGGTNGIRAFRVRAVGPGSYLKPDTLANDIFIDQTGEIKLETNIEYRFDMFSVIEGALFLDAGNVWTLEKDPLRVGAQFEPRDFYNKIAVGGGVGARLDLSYFVIRLDAAFPFRKPWLVKGNRWVFDDIRFGDAAWRRENLIWNLAIGYPF